MKAIISVLFAALFLLIAFRLSRRERLRKISTFSFSPDGIQDEAQREFYQFMIDQARSNTEIQPEGMDEYFQAIMENADPDSPNQVIMFDEMNNVLIISSGIMGRLARGDDGILELLLEVTEQHPDCGILVQDVHAKSA